MTSEMEVISIIMSVPLELFLEIFFPVLLVGIAIKFMRRPLT